MAKSEIPFEEFRVTVEYKSVLPEHSELVLNGLEEFGTPGMVKESSFERDHFSISFDPEVEDDEGLILDAMKATMREIYGPVGAAWSQIDGEWR